MNSLNSTRALAVIKQESIFFDNSDVKIVRKLTRKERGDRLRAENIITKSTRGIERFRV